MAKTQLNVRIEEDAAVAARQAADARHLSVQEYIEQLVRADNDPHREKFLASAGNIVGEFGDLIEERASAARH